MDKNFLEQQLSELPLYTFFYTDPAKLEFSDRIRYICQAECPRYGKSWARPVWAAWQNARQSAWATGSVW